MEEKSFVLVLMSLLMLLWGCDCVKECTNIPLTSHGIQAEMAVTNNATWREEMISLFKLYDDKVNPFVFLTGEVPLPETQPLDWDAMTRQIKNPVFIPPKGFLKEVPLQDVRLHAGTIHGRAQQTNLEYLLMLDPDRLIWSFRNTAGLPTPGTHYGGWESPSGKDIELRGHFVGHYLSGAALTWAATKNENLKQKMTAVVAGMAACQEKMGTGYLSAFPTEFFDRLEEFEQYVWAPYYTIHKIMAGLLDQHTIAGNPQALKMVTGMADYFYKRVVNVITRYTIHRHYLIQNVEAGGMNDILYKLYSITKDSKHLLLAHLFDKPCFLGLLAVQANDIAWFHANTHIPLVVGAQARYEVTGDPTYKEMGAFFMETINSSHIYATGGTSVDEFWKDPGRIADNIKTAETEESCATYNMLKVSRNLFRWTKGVSYAEHYERALTNGVLSIQRGTEPGVMTYMLPLGLGFSKAKTWRRWGTPFDSFWCCYGTGIESFGKLGDSIYFEEEGGKRPTLYIIQYISSSLNWTSGSVFINQTVVPASSSDPYLRVTYTFSPVVGTSSTLKLRVPSWTRVDGARVTLNSKVIPLPAPGTFLTITRKWSAVDKVTLQFPMTIRTEAIKDTRPQYASIQAILYGPYVLAGHTTNNWGWDIKAAAATSDWITPIPADYNNQLVSLSQDIANATFALTNINQTLTLQKLPGPGTDLAPGATFRLILKQSSSNVSTPNEVIASAVGKTLMLEAFDFPGMNLMHQGPDKPLIINVDSSQGGTSSSFLVVPGLDGRNGTISLESQSNRDCYVHSGLNSGAGVKLSCQSKPDANFNQATSFVVGKGISQYNPISFVAKGVKKNFLLEPLFNFRDEHYTTYFNFKQ